MNICGGSLRKKKKPNERVSSSQTSTKGRRKRDRITQKQTADGGGDYEKVTRCAYPIRIKNCACTGAGESQCADDSTEQVFTHDARIMHLHQNSLPSLLLYYHCKWPQTDTRALLIISNLNTGEERNRLCEMKNNVFQLADV